MIYTVNPQVWIFLIAELKQLPSFSWLSLPPVLPPVPQCGPADRRTEADEVNLVRRRCLISHHQKSPSISAMSQCNLTHSVLMCARTPSASAYSRLE